MGVERDKFYTLIDVSRWRMVQGVRVCLHDYKVTFAVYKLWVHPYSVGSSIVKINCIRFRLFYNVNILATNQVC